MPRYVDHQEFVDEDIELDGRVFDHCTFTRCRMIFRAQDSVTFNACTFAFCAWVLDGAAERTLLYLSALYHGLKPEGLELVEGFFRAVRDGTLGGEITLTTAIPEPATA